MKGKEKRKRKEGGERKEGGSERGFPIPIPIPNIHYLERWINEIDLLQIYLT